MPRPNNREITQAHGGAFMRNVYVAGLPPNFTDALLLNLITANCCDAGLVESLKCVMDPRSHQCRGFGFVLFRDAGQATNAVQTLDGSSIPDHLGRLHSLQVRPAHPSAQPTKHDISTRSAAQVSTKAPPPYNSVCPPVGPGTLSLTPQLADPAPRGGSAHMNVCFPHPSNASAVFPSDPVIGTEGSPLLDKRKDEQSCASSELTTDTLFASPLISPQVCEATTSAASSSLRVGQESRTSSTLDISATFSSMPTLHDCQASATSVFHNAPHSVPPVQMSGIDGSACAFVATPPAQAVPMPAQVLLLPQTYGMVGDPRNYSFVGGVQSPYGCGPLMLHTTSYPPVGHQSPPLVAPSYHNPMFYVAAPQGPPLPGGPTCCPIGYSFVPDSAFVFAHPHALPHLIQISK